VLAGLAVLILYPAPHNITIGVTVSLVSVLFYVAQNFLIPTARTLGPLDLIVSGYLLPVFFIQIRVDNQLIFGRISSSEYFWISSPTPGSYLALSVTDTGPRHGPDVVAQIFGPYFTTKKFRPWTRIIPCSGYHVFPQCGSGANPEPGVGSQSCFPGRCRPNQVWIKLGYPE
jgi:hypothetical protein